MALHFTAKPKPKAHKDLRWPEVASQAETDKVGLAKPWARLALILGVVAGLTAAASLVFRSARLRARFAAP
jgi:hypothetical protein